MLLVLFWSIFFVVGANGGILKARGSGPHLPMHVVKKAVTATQSLPVLSGAEISSFRPFTFYASTAYCQPPQILSWQCGGQFLAMHMETYIIERLTLVRILQRNVRLTQLFVPWLQEEMGPVPSFGMFVSIWHYRWVAHK